MWALTKPLQDLKDQNELIDGRLEGGKRVPPVEDLLEALVAGHLHTQLHHLVHLLRLVSVLAPEQQRHNHLLPVVSLFHGGVLAPLLHHLGGTGPDGLLGDRLGHAGEERRCQYMEEQICWFSTWAAGSSRRLQKSPHRTLRRR